MMKAGRSWETLALLVGYGGWTREVLSVVLTECPCGRLTCPSFGDKPEYKYCCPSMLERGSYYCCDYQEKQAATKAPPSSKNIPEIVGGIIGAICFLIVALLLSCFFCTCCYFYKRRQLCKRPETQQQHSSGHTSVLGARYRNWPRNVGSENSRYSQYYRPADCTRGYRRSACATTTWRHPVERVHASGLSLEHQRPEYERFLNGASTAYLGPRGQIPPLIADLKSYEGPPPYPIAHHYPSCPPSMLNGCVTPATTHESTLTDTATSTVSSDQQSPELKSPDLLDSFVDYSSPVSDHSNRPD